MQEFTVKGIVSRDEYFLKVPINLNITFCISIDGFHNYGLFFLRKLKTMFLLASANH